MFGLAEIALADLSFRMVAVGVNGIKFPAQIQVSVPNTNEVICSSKDFANK